MSNGGIGVGRIVRYVMPEGRADRPAIVTEVVVGSGGVGSGGGQASGEPHVNLTVFFDRSDGRYEALGQYENVAHDEAKAAHTWHWPART